MTDLDNATTADNATDFGSTTAADNTTDINNATRQNNLKKWLVLGIAPVVLGAIHHVFAALQSHGDWVETVFLIIGMYGGFGLLLADVEWLYQHYFEETAKNATKPVAPPEYITRSALFILTLLPLTIFMLTSTGSALGMGLLMGILIGLSLEMFALRRNPTEFQARFLSQVKRIFTPEEIEWVVMIFSGFTAVVSVLVIL